MSTAAPEIASATDSETETESVPEVPQSRNYTGEDEKDAWWYVKRWAQDGRGYHDQNNPYWINKEEFRQRRSSYYYSNRMTSLRINYENNDEIGAFLRLTNAYALVAAANDSEHFFKTIAGDLGEIPVISATLAGCRIVGRMCVGNKNGLLVPDTVYDNEFEKIKNDLPDSVNVVKMEEKLSALGNVIVCNDRVALIHPDLNKESEEIIADTLQVEVFRTMIGTNPLVGSYCVLNNNGGLVQPEISKTELDNLSSLLQISLAAGTVNGGSKVVGSGLAVNDCIAYAGMKTTSAEFSVIDSVFQLTPKRN